MTNWCFSRCQVTDPTNDFGWVAKRLHCVLWDFERLLNSSFSRKIRSCRVNFHWLILWPWTCLGGNTWSHILLAISRVSEFDFFCDFKKALEESLFRWKGIHNRFDKVYHIDIILVACLSHVFLMTHCLVKLATKSWCLYNCEQLLVNTFIMLVLCL